MDAQKQARLRGLTPREKRYLFYIFQNTKRTAQDIASLTEKTEDTVRGIRTAVYKKLGIAGNDQEKRAKLTLEYKEDFDLLYPTLEAIEGREEGQEDTREGQTEPQEARQEGSGGTLPPPPQRRVRPWVVIAAILAGFSVISVCVVTALFFTLRALNRTPQAPAETSPTIAPAVAPTQAPTLTVIAPTATTQPTSAPSATLSPPTLTPAPLPTDTPAPQITSAFSDDFAGSPSSQWSVLNGPWMIAEGRYTVLGGTENIRDEWLWSVIDGPGWTNYRVKTDYKINYPYAANQGQIALAVRMSSGQRLVFTVDNFMQGAWGLMEGTRDPELIGVSHGEYVPASGTIMLEVKGNDFTAYVNGSKIQTLNLGGFERGGVGLGIYCQLGTECPSFDNFSIEPLP